MAQVFVELGIAIVALGLLARLANRWRLSAIPLYLLLGLAFGNGGLLPLPFSHDFVHVGAELGVALLLFYARPGMHGRRTAGQPAHRARRGRARPGAQLPSRRGRGPAPGMGVA